MEIPCTKREMDLFERVAEAARQIGVPCYLIGGFVRDKLLNRPTKDVDIVCVGDGIALAHQVASLLDPNLRVNYFKTYGTAQIRFDEIEMEFVGARRESYRDHSRNPEVEPVHLKMISSAAILPSTRWLSVLMKPITVSSLIPLTGWRIWSTNSSVPRWNPGKHSVTIRCV